MTEPDRARLVKEYTNQAMNLLARAIEQGFNDATRLEADPRFAPLRNRKNFRPLIDELMARPKPRDR